MHHTYMHYCVWMDIHKWNEKKNDILFIFPLVRPEHVQQYSRAERKKYSKIHWSLCFMFIWIKCFVSSFLPFFIYFSIIYLYFAPIPLLQFVWCCQFPISLVHFVLWGNVHKIHTTGFRMAHMAWIITQIRFIEVITSSYPTKNKTTHAWIQSQVVETDHATPDFGCAFPFYKLCDAHMLSRENKQQQKTQFKIT